MELVMGIEPMTSSLPRKCSTTELHKQICYVPETKQRRNMGPCRQGGHIPVPGPARFRWKKIFQFSGEDWLGIAASAVVKIREFENRLPQSVADTRRSASRVKGIFSFGDVLNTKAPPGEED